MTEPRSTSPRVSTIDLAFFKLMDERDAARAQLAEAQALNIDLARAVVRLMACESVEDLRTTLERARRIVEATEKGPTT